MFTDSHNPQGNHDAYQASSAFMSFLQRNGGTAATLADALAYQAAQARSGTQEITTPHQEAMKAWAAQLAAERQAQLRELTTLIKEP